MKPPDIPIPKTFEEEQKRYEVLAAKIHQHRKKGADMRMTWYKLQLAKNRLLYWKISSSDRDYGQYAQYLKDAEDELSFAINEHSDHIENHHQKGANFVKHFVEKGEQLLEQKKFMQAKFLYLRVSRLYEDASPEVKKRILADCTRLRHLINVAEKQHKKA